MTPSDAERVAAKVEEVDRLIAELQKRRRELLSMGGAAVVTPSPSTNGAGEARAPDKAERAPARGAGTPEPARAKNALERTLDSLPWKSFKKKEGEWAFLRDREGRLIDELQSEKEFVERARKEGQVVVGKYRYQISEDRFLNRYYAGS